MAEESLLRDLVVRSEPALTRPRPGRVANAVAELGGQPALADVEHLVPAPRPVEAEHRPVLPGSEGVLQLVAVVELGLGRERRLERRVGDAAQPHEGIPHLGCLFRELHVVGEILEATAAARGEVVAGRLDAVGARLHDLHRHRLRVAAANLRHAGAHDVAGQAATHEEHEAVQPPDAVAAVRKRVDPDLDLVTGGDGGGSHY